MQKYMPVVEKCPLFYGMKPEEITAILACLGATKKEYGKNAPIFLEGDPAGYLGVLLSGSAQIVRDDYYGRRSIVSGIDAGQIFGEAFACAGVERMPVSVIATSQSAALIIDCHRIATPCSNACAFHSRLMLNLLRVVANKNLLINRKLEIISRRTTREKLLTYLMNQAKLNRSDDFTIPFNRQELADYLGVERSALCAEISKLRFEGILESRRNSFHLLKNDAQKA